MTNGVMEIHESEYNEILRRCVAVINNARKMLAQQVASTASDTYWEIGKLLHERKLDSKYGSNIVKRLSVDLKEQFPDMGTSPRQLWNMKAFYERYKDSDEKLLRSVAVLKTREMRLSKNDRNLLLNSKKIRTFAKIFANLGCTRHNPNKFGFCSHLHELCSAKLCYTILQQILMSD